MGFLTLAVCSAFFIAVHSEATSEQSELMDIFEDCISDESDNEYYDSNYNIDESNYEDNYDALELLEDVMDSYYISNSRDSYVSFREKNRHLCGGALINVYWIITVPTCVHKFPSLSAVTAVLGVAHSLNNVVCHVGLVKSVERCNDLALVKMLTAVALSNFISETPLSSEETFHSDIDEFGVSVVWRDECMELLERADRLVGGCDDYIYILGDKNLLPGPHEKPDLLLFQRGILLGIAKDVVNGSSISDNSEEMYIRFVEIPQKLDIICEALPDDCSVTIVSRANDDMNSYHPQL